MQDAKKFASIAAEVNLRNPPQAGDKAKRFTFFETRVDINRESKTGVPVTSQKDSCAYQMNTRVLHNFHLQMLKSYRLCFWCQCSTWMVCLRQKSFLVHYYRLQRSWGKVIFSEACVKNSVHMGGGGIRAGGACVADTMRYGQ